MKIRFLRTGHSICIVIVHVSVLFTDCIQHLQYHILSVLVGEPFSIHKFVDVRVLYLLTFC